MANKTYISWDAFHRDVKNLSKKIREKGNFNRIIAVSRGGLLPAGILAYKLDIRNVDSINICSYDGSNLRQDDKVEIKNNFADTDEHTLIIDDLADSGRTVEMLRRIYPKACLATVYAKPAGQNVPAIYEKALPDNWVVFPWDE